MYEEEGEAVFYSILFYSMLFSPAEGEESAAASREDGGRRRSRIPTQVRECVSELLQPHQPTSTPASPNVCQHQPPSPPSILSNENAPELT